MTSNPNKLRNISQSHQEREIVKTAPDMVVYIDGLPFILNPYLSSTADDLQTVNFNDFVTAISTSYSVDQFIPSGTISLSIPNGFKHLFLAPGGMTIFEPMASVRIYAKSYFFSERGNTVYRRIFHGLLKSVSMNESQTSLELSLSIVGICRLMELVQVELKRSLSSYSSVTVFDAIYDTFDRVLDFSELIKNSLQEKMTRSSAETKSLQTEYVQRWAVRLHDLRKEIRLFGYRETKDINAKLTAPINKGNGNPATEQATVKPNQSDTQTATMKDNADVFKRLTSYTFDKAVGGQSLLGNQLMPRIDRVRNLVDMAGLEGYQDIDGLIIIKPPLYNLDCTMLGSSSIGSNITSDQTYTNDLADENLYEDANPYIIHMAEILSEGYVEDETAVRRTSMVVSCNFGKPAGMQIEGHIDLTPTVRYVDIDLMRKFGVREEPTKYIGYLDKDLYAMMGYAVCELHKANKGYRTYTVSIPLRPELRLGFPIYLPHKDMYGYITSASISYNVGGQATMSLTCNYIRKRPLFPQKRSLQTKEEQSRAEDLNNLRAQAEEQGGIPNESKNSAPSNLDEAIVYTSQPNLVHYWFAGTPEKSENTSPVDKKGVEANEVLLKSDLPTPEEAAKALFHRYKHGTLHETHVNTATGRWVIGVDDAKLRSTVAAKVKDLPKGQFLFNAVLKDGEKTEAKLKIADVHYMRLTSMVQPYTDEKGYEVIPILPWGRYTTLRQALVDCTRNYWFKGSADEKEKVQEELQRANAFLFSGMSIPGVTNTRQLLDNLKSARSHLQDLEREEGTSASLEEVDAAKDAAEAGLQQKSKSLQELLTGFTKFERSNVISFELEHAEESESQPLDFIRTDVSGFGGSQSLFAQVDPTMDFESASPTIEITNKVMTFLLGAVGYANTGRYAVSTLPQNTPVGGFSVLSSPAMGVLGSIRAQFEAGPLGTLLGTARTSSPYFTSGYESRGNRSW
jgi:hypothetical protein